VGAGGIIAFLRPTESYDLSLFACGIFAASWLPTILMSLLWKRYNASAAFYGMFSGAAALALLQALITNQTLVLPDIMQYIISMVISILVSVVVTLRSPPDPSNARRYYQIRDAQLSDLVVREARTSPGALPELVKGYYQARTVMAAVVLLTVLVLLFLCFLFYRYII